MKFESKIDLWLVILIFGAFAISFGSALVPVLKGNASMNQALVTILLAVLFSGLFIWLMKTTYYVLGDKELIIRSGPIRKKILYYEIKSARKSRNPISSPALSLKRIEILHVFGMALISPKDRDGFLTLLAEKCPNATISKDY
ncbi:PH domain-containing protein [Bacillus sp. NEB1478]|uniref:PH domain-containing protein n=1 Tax=Bacillus sp. NEB1478 TaxID=3073816 RepID=UPI002873751A|nr:PH domain-containing protein [Bacillus sp. NEB1478]WNB90817.1 PH domain-containing protein [Bacillus sp. NEB1478]